MERKFYFEFVLVLVVFSNGSNIDRSLLQFFISNTNCDILVNFFGANLPAINKIKSQSFGNRFEKIKVLTNSLQSLANITQGPIEQHLQEQNIASQKFWASNQMVVKNANLSTVKGIAAFGQVSRIQVLPMIKLNPLPSDGAPVATSTTTGVTWNIEKIQAHQAWSQFNTNGAGVCVANIDTGVRLTHEALAGNWRSDHGWFDPYTNTKTPIDGNGHGTHTMGTICGRGPNGIGVAPGANWIACRGCDTSSCAGDKLLKCGQFMLCPTNPDGTNPDCTKCPNVVSNSWGSMVGGDDWYNGIIAAWEAARICHAFAIGNSGPGCGTGGSPGDQAPTFSVGSTDINDKLSSFSSKGPAGTVPNTYPKPDVSAPGSNVMSAWNTGDNVYKVISGTSMATPHVAGTLALLCSVFLAKHGNKAEIPNFNQTIANTADTEGLSGNIGNSSCDVPIPNGGFPNSNFGYGRINALKAVTAIVNPAPGDQ